MKKPLRTPAEKHQHRDISRQETIICADLGYFKNPEGIGVSEHNEHEHKWTLNDQSNARQLEYMRYMERKQASIETSEKILAVTLVVGIVCALLAICALGIGELLKGTL